MLAVSILTDCKHKPLIPDQPEVSFSRDVLPIIGGNCTEAGCHGTTNTSEFELITYDDVMKDQRIIAGDADHSKIYRAITATSGENMMPVPPRPSLSEIQVRMIYVWIMQGAKNN